METLPKRKPLRLRDYDYNSTGAYFVTICVQNRVPLLARFVEPVGDGAHDVPSETSDIRRFKQSHDGTEIHLTATGHIVEKYLLSSENISGVTIDRYVIMPDHIHVIIHLDNANGTSKAPSPTNAMLPHVISTFKRFCHKEIGKSIFQRGYMEHVIRDREDYNTRLQYMFRNPFR